MNTARKFPELTHTTNSTPLKPGINEISTTVINRVDDLQSGNRTQKEIELFVYKKLERFKKSLRNINNAQDFFSYIEKMPELFGISGYEFHFASYKKILEEKNVNLKDELEVFYTMLDDFLETSDSSKIKLHKHTLSHTEIESLNGKTIFDLKVNNIEIGMFSVDLEKLSLPKAIVGRIIKSIMEEAANFLNKMYLLELYVTNIDLTSQLESTNRKLESLALTDPLTELNNRRAIEEKLNSSINCARRDKDLLTVLMIDADNFKIVNDTYGHYVGDFVLKTLAKTLNGAIRANDMLGRYGGEEFIMVIKHKCLKDIEPLIERVLGSVRELNFDNTEANGLHLTVSVGAYTGKPSGGETNGDFIRKADEALYEAKKRGRNRVHHSNESYEEILKS